MIYLWYIQRTVSLKAIQFHPMVTNYSSKIDEQKGKHKLCNQLFFWLKPIRIWASKPSTCNRYIYWKYNSSSTAARAHKPLTGSFCPPIPLSVVCVCAHCLRSTSHIEATKNILAESIKMFFVGKLYGFISFGRWIFFFSSFFHPLNFQKRNHKYGELN